MSQWIKGSLFVLAVVVAAVAGLYFGLGLRERLQPADVRYETFAPNHLLGAGEEFPHVPIMATDSAMTTTSDLLTDGGVVIFMELGCPPCSVMSQNWSKALQSWNDPPPVFGIAYASLERIARYRDYLSIEFPIYSDTGDVFATAYQVTDYPMRLIVDTAGVIRSQAYDCHELVDPLVVARLIAGDTGVSATSH